MDATKTCERCGRGFSRPSSFSAQTWSRQRFCTLTCANRARAEGVRIRGSETKPCEHCGRQMTWPRNYSAKQWAAKRYCDKRCAGAAQRAATDRRRPVRTCPVCGASYRAVHAPQRTCRNRECVDEYRRTVTAPASAQRMRADYASGKRKPAAGISPRERLLWPLLRGSGWVWRLRWVEEEGEYELDFAYREAMLNVEIDGIEHREPRGLARDATRDAALKTRGWRILRIANEDVDEDVAAVAARIKEWAAAVG